jgi:hypothetical protein
MGSFSLSGGVEVFGFISPSNTTDQYPVIDPLYGIDGLRNVNTLSDLNLIPTLRRRAGMLVGVSGGTTFYKLNLPPWNGTLSDWSLFELGFTGGTVTGNTIFTNGVTANTFSAATYLGLPSDIYVSGFTYLDNTLTIERSSGNPNLFVTINDFTGLTINGDLNVTGNTIVDGITANTISASTYLNLPIDVFVTGGTYDNVSGTATFTNNTGGTFNISGLFTGATDVYVTGGTYNDNTFIFTNVTGGTFSVSFNSVSGLTINGDLNVTGSTIVDGVTANTISATTYQNLPIDPDTYITAFTYNNNLLTIDDNSGNTFNVIINDFTGLTINGDLNVMGNTIVDGISANTISATTYQNLPIDVFVTGGTFSGGVITLINNTGGTFSVSGISSFDTFVTGFSYSDNTFTISQNSGTTFSATIDSVTGLTVNGNLDVIGTTSSGTISATTYQNLPTDIRVTGGTYSNGTATFTNNTGGTFNVVGLYTGGTDVFVTGATYSNNTFTYTNNTGGTFSTSFNTLTGLTINGNLSVTGTTSSGTISATTYQNLPTDIRVTGGTYSNGSVTFTNNIGGTFSVTGFVTGDTFTTGFSYSNNTFTINRNNGQANLTATINSVTGLTSTGTISSSVLSAATYQNSPIEIQAACSDETTAITAGVGKVTFRAPCAFTLTNVRASLTTAQTSGNIFTIDINLGGTSVLSTKLTIDNTERTSVTAVTPPIISTSTITDDGEISVDVDQIGDGTAKGLKITMIGTRV